MLLYTFCSYLCSVESRNALAGAANIVVPFVASGDLSGFDAKKTQKTSQQRYFAYQQQQEKVTIET